MKDEREEREGAEVHQASSGAAGGHRRRYVRPELVEFGGVNDLTRGKSGTKGDGGKRRK